MPKKIVLVEPPYGKYDFEYVPQGLLSIAAILEDAGHDVKICDGASTTSCDILGISATISQYDQALDVARKSDAEMIVIGGAIATTSPVEAVRSSLIDYAIIGDGEGPLLELANGNDIRSIPGIAYTTKDCATVINPNLDFKYSFRGKRHPVPAYHLLDSIGDRINIVRNREYSWGWRWQRKNRPKYWEDFNKEVGVLYNIGVRSVYVTDEHFGDWHDNIKSTIDALDRFDSWSCKATTETVLARELHDKLANSKCTSIELDIKSASDRMLDELGTTTVEDHNIAYDLLNDIGISVTVCATIGLPGETMKSMMDTWHWLRGKRARINTFTPMPGTVHYEYCQNYSQFGFDIIGIDRHDFIIDDSRPAYSLPWVSRTIDSNTFLELRNQMISELAVSYGK